MINKEHARQILKPEPKEADASSYSNYSELDVTRAREARLHENPAKAGVAHSKEFAMEHGLEVYNIQKKGQDMAAHDDEEDDLIRKFKL
jgi:hypothetical protein